MHDLHHPVDAAAGVVQQRLFKRLQQLKRRRKMKFISTKLFDPLCSSTLSLVRADTLPPTVLGAGSGCIFCLGANGSPPYQPCQGDSFNVNCCCSCFNAEWPGGGGDTPSNAEPSVPIGFQNSVTLLGSGPPYVTGSTVINDTCGQYYRPFTYAPNTPYWGYTINPGGIGDCPCVYNLSDVPTGMVATLFQQPDTVDSDGNLIWELGIQFATCGSLEPTFWLHYACDKFSCKKGGVFIFDGHQSGTLYGGGTIPDQVTVVPATSCNTESYDALAGVTSISCTFDSTFASSPFYSPCPNPITATGAFGPGGWQGNCAARFGITIICVAGGIYVYAGSNPSGFGNEFAYYYSTDVSNGMTLDTSNIYRVLDNYYPDCNTTLLPNTIIPYSIQLNW
jgi:hypothetical protein